MSQLQPEQIMSALVDSCTHTGRRPSSLAAFARQVEFPEDTVRVLFPGLMPLDQAIFRWFWDESVRLIQAEPGYAEYSLQERLLTLYYTLFALLAANQSYVQLSLSPLSGLLRLNRLQQAFAQELPALLGLPDAQEPLTQLRTRVTIHTLWLQFLTLLAFWLQDRSVDRARSDALIETSVAALFEIRAAFQFQQTAAWLRFWAEELAERQWRLRA